MSDKKPALNRESATCVLSSMIEGNHIDPRKVDTNINWVGSTGKKLDATMHATAVACIHLSMPHVDGGHNCAIRAIKLLNAMPKGSRAKALAAWFEAFSNVRVRFDKEAKAWVGGVLKPTAKGYAPARPTEAMGKPFWTVEEADVSPKAFDDNAFAAAVRALIKRAKGENATLDAAGLAALADLEGVAAKLPAEASV